jgi:hypothetical protein
MTEISIRSAGREDSATIAELFLISSDGLAEYIWSKVAEPGESPLQAGARRYARVGVAFSFQNCVLAEIGGTIAGIAHSFPMDADPAAGRKPMPFCAPMASSRTTAASTCRASPYSPSIAAEASARN